MRLRVGAATHIGRVRALNEDVYLVRAERGLFVVCDGVGGTPAGEVASRMAVDNVLDRLRAVNGTALASSGSREKQYLPQTASLLDAVRYSNRFIYEEAQKDPRHAEMGTTLVGVCLKQHIASVVHVGDSRAYLWHDGRLEPLTRDHSLVEAQIHAGLLDRAESVHAAHQNILVRVLGREPDVDVDVNEVPLQSGDYLLLCSDGLTRMVAEPALAETISKLRDPQRICDYLIDAANRNGGADNITVVVVQVVGSWWRRLATVAGLWRQHAGGGHDAETHPAV
jgi:serine/threonine protein phosphatase PrpC